MGLQSYLFSHISLTEKIKKEYDTCPGCNRDKKYFHYNQFGTLECQCGIKFYNVIKEEK